MTLPIRPGVPTLRLRRAAARVVRIALPLLIAPLVASGCGMRVLGHRGEPVERKDSREPAERKTDGRKTDERRKDERSRMSAAEKQILDAREQMGLDPREPYWPYRLGQILAEKDSVVPAEAALRSSLERDPGYAPALSLLSKLHYDGGRHAEAIALLEAARSRPGAFPQGVPPELLAGLALHYEATGRHDLAAALVADANRAGPGRARSAVTYVTLRGGDAAARELASAALDENSRSAANQNNAGIAKLKAGDPKSARALFMRAIELDPTLPGPYYNLAILERHYRFDEAAAARWLEAYRKRAGRDPGQDPDGLFVEAERAAPRPVAKEERRP